MKYAFFMKQNEKFHIQKFVFLLIFLISYLLQATATSCPLLLSGIIETHRAINIEGLDLQVFDLSVRQIMWTRYRPLMGLLFQAGNKWSPDFAFTLNEVILKIQLRMFQL